MPGNAFADATNIIRCDLQLAEVDDDELAFVIAHELAHVVCGHLHDPRRQQLMGVADSAAQLANLPAYNALCRADELEADRLSQQWISRAGFAADGGMRWLARADEVERKAATPPLPPELLDHDPPLVRKGLLEQHLAANRTLELFARTSPEQSRLSVLVEQNRRARILDGWAEAAERRKV